MKRRRYLKVTKCLACGKDHAEVRTRFNKEGQELFMCPETNNSVFVTNLNK